MSALSVKVCTGTGCVANGSLAVVQAFRAALEGGADDEVRVEAAAEAGLGIAGCRGFCAAGPLVRIPELDLLYCGVRPSDVAEIVDKTVRRGEIVERLLFHDPADGRAYRFESEVPFFRKQVRRVLARCGEVDPENLDDYVGHGGYLGLTRALREVRPEEVVEEIKRSGLRGRGGAGFPTGLKWQLVAESPGRERFIVCNGDEGDPGAFMDRSIMEGDPHAVVEGLCIAAYAVGARRGYVYVRSEYPLAVRRMEIALEQARHSGYLGKAILDSEFDFDATVVEGAGAFVCGEETALLGSIEGRRGMPSPRPPYPARRGLRGLPTLISNVETLANVPAILALGSSAFSGVGTGLSRGTKTFALTGKLNNVGLAEVPLGITLREVVEEIGGGVPQGHTFKAAQIGGPSGGCLPARHLDTPLDYRSLQELGAMMGSGGLVVMDETVCMVRMARFFMEFCAEESCGKCPPCRIGTRVMLNLLDGILAGRGRPEDLERLVTLGDHMRRTSLCGLGQTAPNPTLSALRHFRDEFEAHLRDRSCPAGECFRLPAVTTEPELCDGCASCTPVCPAGAISGESSHVHRTDEESCQHCGSCLTVCPTGAIKPD